MREQVLTWLAQHVTTPRINHILRVEVMAIELAACYGLEPHKAAQAALMHDLAKYFQPQKLLHMAMADGLEIDEITSATPHLLHADVSAIIARDTFGIKDEEVLQAIANHTLGRPGMSPLCCIVFIADSLEPGRGNTAQLQTLRQISRENLEMAVWHVCDYSLKFLVENHCMIHPRTIATRNWFLQKSNPKQPLAKSPA